MNVPALRFKGDTGGWGVKRLIDLAKVYDGTHMTPDYKEAGVPFYSVEHLTNNNFKDTKYISADVYEKENKRVMLEMGDILMTRIGDIGTAKYINWDIKASFYVSLALIKQSKNINAEFLSHFISSPYFQKELHQRTIHVAFPKKINLGEIGECLVSFPRNEEQTKIANFLTAVDEKITQLTQKHDLLTQYKKGVMQQIFSQELRFKDDDGGDFPVWEKTQLGDIVEIMQSGVSRMLNDSDIGLPVIRSNNLIDNKLDISDLKYWYTLDNQGVNLANYFLKDGDLLVNFINSLAQIGKVALFENLLNRDTIFTTNLMRLSFKNNVNTKYIACFFQTNDYIQHIQAITKPAVNQASFTTKEFKALVIPFPSKQEQTKIANFLTAIDDKITATQTQLQAVKQYKQGLLQQMFV